MATKRIRTSAKSSFTRAITKFNKIICDNEPVEVLLVIYTDIERKFKNLMGKNDKYLESIEEEYDQAEEWLNQVEDQYSQIRIKYAKYKIMFAEQSSVRALYVQGDQISAIVASIADMMENQIWETIIFKEKGNLV